ncbi:MAG: phosphate regulon sensor histidine kinase PhoR [Aquabacterium sp.]|nr:MAG: phosphate regulon sensor histidine kinase PhoR [Aquabacterium sp.]
MPSWLIPRVLKLWAALGLGSLVGFLGGRQIHAPLMGTVLGLGGASFLFLLRDLLPGYRLAKWLREPSEQPAPALHGPWGEVGYRAERLLRLRERELEEQRRRLEQFFTAIDAAPNGVTLLDASDHVLWFSSMAADHFGLEPKRDIGQRITNLVRAPALLSYLQAGNFDEPVKITQPSGQGTLMLVLRAYGDGHKLMLSQDITERERAETMRRDFVANVSHEIRTPLTVLAGFIESMTHLQLTDVERKRVLGLMAQQTDRMQALVSDLLTLAKLEGSPRPAMDRWVPVSKLMAHVESDARSLSGGRHKLSFTPLDDAAVKDIELAGSETELISALANLAGNAVRYTPADGSVDVRWAILPDGQGEFSVTDTGVGIDREHIPRLTERFYRVDGSRARETGGTGLGLSIVKHVAQRHAGELRIDSEVGKGSRFSLLFPAARVRGGSQSSPGAAPALNAEVQESWPPLRVVK